MANTFKKVIDRQLHVQVAPSPNAHAAGGALCSDMRSDVSRNPFVYQLVSNTVLNRFNIVQKAWALVQSPALAGTFGAGAAMVFAPSLGAKGSINATGATTSKFALTTALPAAVGVNMLANRGGSGEYGFKIRVIGKTAGKVEERFIVGNTGGTTPTIDLDNPLTFTPAAGDEYEILSGRVFMLGAGTTASNIWRSIEIASNALSSGLSTTNLPTTIGTDTSLLALDEQYTPYDCEPGEGFIKGTFKYDDNLVERFALAATAATSTTITGQAAGGDAGVVANEYRNFQIRIVHDAVNPTAVGQRRFIASHTGPGASPVYTLGAAWAVTPSSSAKFVIEYPNLIVGRSSATTTVYTYNYSDQSYINGTTTIATNAWSTTCFGAAPAANASGGHWMPSFGIRPDVSKNARHSFCYFWRGGAATLDVLDIAGGTTGTWAGAVVVDGAQTLTVGTCGAYSPFGQEGRFHYMNVYVASAVNQLHRFDVQNRVMSPVTPTDILQSGTAALGCRMAAYAAIDGADKYDTVLLLGHLSTVAQELIVLV